MNILNERFTRLKFNHSRLVLYRYKRRSVLYIWNILKNDSCTRHF